MASPITLAATRIKNCSPGNSRWVTASHNHQPNEERITASTINATMRRVRWHAPQIIRSWCWVLLKVVVWNPAENDLSICPEYRVRFRFESVGTLHRAQL